MKSSLFRPRTFTAAIGTLALLCGASLSLTALDEVRQSIVVKNTQHIDLPAGGTLSLKNSSGELTIEAWDQPGIELITIKTTKAEYTAAERAKGSPELERIKISTERKGDELIVSTAGPEHPNFIEYQIKAPRDTKLNIGHKSGEVHLVGLTSDIRATVSQGLITLRLPDQDQYAVDAKSRFGKVYSDFPGSTKREHLIGNEFVESSQAPHKLDLKIKFGDILIEKLWKPGATPPLIQ